jgi:predicted transcriptional regulator
MTAAQQLALPFACLDFPDRDSVSAREIAAKLGVTRQHILDHIEAGKLVAIDTSLVGTRRNPRVAVDEYRRWVLSLLTAPARRSFLTELPHATLRELQQEIAAILVA